eukprot:10634403-Karenia_brevis.AAC.1
MVQVGNVEKVKSTAGQTPAPMGLAAKNKGMATKRNEDAKMFDVSGMSLGQFTNALGDDLVAWRSHFSKLCHAL